jgi:hypothetical protein
MVHTRAGMPMVHTRAGMPMEHTRVWKPMVLNLGLEHHARETPLHWFCDFPKAHIHETMGLHP